MTVLKFLTLTPRKNEVREKRLYPISHQRPSFCRQPFLTFAGYKSRIFLRESPMREPSSLSLLFEIAQTKVSSREEGAKENGYLLRCPFSFFAMTQKHQNTSAPKHQIQKNFYLLKEKMLAKSNIVVYNIIVL